MSREKEPEHRDPAEERRELLARAKRLKNQRLSEDEVLDVVEKGEHRVVYNGNLDLTS